MQAFCTACHAEIELQVVNLDSATACPRCGRTELEPLGSDGLPSGRGGSAPVVSRDEFSHTLRTPLTVIKGSLQHLIKHWDALGDRDRKVLVKAVLDQADVAVDAVATFEDRLSAGTDRSSADLAPEVERA